MPRLLSFVAFACAAWLVGACSPSGGSIASSSGASGVEFSSTTIASAPAGAITAGSFTVWSVPQNPSEFQPYYIHVLVKLPAATASYPLSDLSGTIAGTDGYQKAIGTGGKAQSFAFDKRGLALLQTLVPGGKRGVSDLIQVRSALLNEQQSIHLYFKTPKTDGLP